MNTLVDGVTYLVADGGGASGLYHGDTRHCSALAVDLADVDLAPVDRRYRRPRSRTTRYTNVQTDVNELPATLASKHATVVLTRAQTVSEGRYRERVSLENRQPEPAEPTVTVEFDADFQDVFEVRGLTDPIDRDVAAAAADDAVTYAYEYASGSSADGPTADRRLTTTVGFDAEPESLSPGRATFAPALAPQETWTLEATVVPGGDESTVRRATDASGGATHSPETGDREPRRIDPYVVEPPETGTPSYDRTIAQSRRDVRALVTRTEQGPVPLAGAPWFVTAFGRDALLASYLLLPAAPSLARGTLRYLAAHQGTERDDGRLEAPGKILHETRSGELARTGAIPQTPYYAAIDATPLWLTLLHETWRWTREDDLVADLWPSLEAALDWLETATGGDDPFCYYSTFGDAGVVHQDWRDSANGVQYADGTVAQPPLATAGVQGYCYDALRRVADLVAGVRGDEARAADLRERARTLAERFDERFWLDCEQCYATAATPDGDRVDAVTSAVGQCLWSGIVPEERADAVVDRLLEPDVFSGWGLRTLGSDAAGYSPVSYHAGCVWPHENALSALGLARYGRREATERLVAAQFDAFAHFSDHSVPELFGGFDDASPPSPFPAACRPQAWAAAAPCGLVRALFDLQPAAEVGAPGTRADDASEAGARAGDGGIRRGATPESTPIAPDAVAHWEDYWR